MDTSHQFIKNPSSTSSSSSLCSQKQRSFSTSQNCLFKILRTISTIPPESTTNIQSLLNSRLKEPEFNDVGFCVSPENQESVSPVTGSENSGEFFGKCKIGKEEKLLDSDSCSVQTNAGELSGEFSGAGEEILEIPASEKSSKMGTCEEKGFMGLLIEAARLIFGEFKDEGIEFEQKKMIRTKQIKRRNKSLGTENVAGKCLLSPVVRSKRGRIQVLPYKYRDSVIEPLTRFSRNRSEGHSIKLKRYRED